MTDNQKLNVVFEQKYHPTIALNDLPPTTPIRDVKDKIFHHTGFVKDKMELQFNGKVMDDGKTLADYSIPNNSHITFKGFDPMIQKMV